MRKFEKYQMNLRIIYKDGVDYIQSYDTLVAKIDWDEREAIVNEWYSVTTSKHINYACKEMGLSVKILY